MVGPDYEGWFARAPAAVYVARATSVDPLDRTVESFRSLVREADPPVVDPDPDEVVFLLMGSTIDQREIERLLAPGHRRLETRTGEGFQIVRFDVNGSDRIFRSATEPASVGGSPVATLFAP